MSYASSEIYLAHGYFHYLKEIVGKSNLVGFRHNDIFNTYYQKSIWNKIMYKLAPWNINSKISNQLLKLCIKESPDILLLFKGMEILPKTLKEIQKQGVFLVNYNLDHPFEFFSKGSGNKNVLDSLPLYNLHITYSSQIEQEMNHKFPNIKTAVLPFGNKRNSKNELPPIEGFEEVNKVCFIGNSDENRVSLIKQIASNKIEVHVYGHNWGTCFTEEEKYVKVFSPMYKDEYIKTLQKYRIQLNIFRPHNKASHNMRTFEVPAVGGIMLAPLTIEHLSFFKPEVEVFYYTNQHSLFTQINTIINLTKEQAYDIRLNAQTRSVQSNYSYQERAIQLLQILNNNYE
jgi:spore maturation protein CgeB